MSVSKSSSTATNYDYIFVKIKGQEKKMKSAKRVAIPGTLEILCKSIQNIFQINDKIRSLYTIDGEFIRDISQLVPRSTIIASNENPKETEFRYDIDQKSSSNLNRHFDPSVKLTFTEFPKPQKKPVSEIAPKCLVIGFPKPLTTDQSNLSYENKHKNNTRTSKQTIADSKILKKKRSNSPLFKKSQNDADSKLIPSQNFHFFDQASYTYLSSDASLSTTAMEPQRVETKKKRFAKKRMNTIRHLFGSSFENISNESNEADDSTMFKNIKGAISKMATDHQNFISTAEEKEYQQKQFWIEQLITMISSFDNMKIADNLFLNDEMHNYAQESIIHHRFISGNSALHKFNIGIVGPPKSGKSTLLGIYTQELLYELSACDDWKSTFFFVLEVNDIEKKLDDYIPFYVNLINQIFDQIDVQKPVFHQLIPIMKKYFHSLIDHPNHLVLSKSISVNSNINTMQNKLEEIGEIIKTAWNTKSGSSIWFTLLFILPSLISKALCFRTIIYIVDNIEKYDITLRPHSPFDHSSALFISEYLKIALSLNEYIFSCSNMEQMFKMLSPIDDDGIDLAAFTEFLPVNGMCKDYIEDDTPLLINLSTTELPFVMKSSDCDGIPYYILLWKDLNRLVDEMQSLDEDTDEFYNLHYSAVMQAQAMINSMFFDDQIDYNDEDDENYPHVLAVRRATQKENAKFQKEQNMNIIHMHKKIEKIFSNENIEEEEEEEEEEEDY